MAQAEGITTAIRELMSRGRPDQSISPVRLAHTEFVAAADTARNVPSGTLDRRYLDNLFRDLSANTLCVIRNAAEEMREHENWRTS